MRKRTYNRVKIQKRSIFTYPLLNFFLQLFNQFSIDIIFQLKINVNSANIL